MTGSRGRALALVLLALVVVVGLIILLRGDDSPPPLTEAQKVFCADIVHREDVVGAAVALGSLAEESNATAVQNGKRPFASYQEWQSADSLAFADACRGAIAARQLERGSAPTSPGSSPYSALIGVAVGALLTLLSSEWRAARDRSRTRADGLRKAIVDFDSATRQYISEWQVQTLSSPSVDDLREKSALLAALLGQALRTTDSDTGRQARSDLASLTDDLGPNRWPAPGDDRERFADQARRGLQDLVRDLHTYGSDYEKWYSWRASWQRATPHPSTP